MLVKYCKKENISLLNIVRRQQQVKLLQEEGAIHIINSSDQNWVDQYKQAIKVHGFNMLFDAIGGGQVSDKLISNFPPLGQAFIQGKLSKEPLVISKPLVFAGGAAVTNFLLFEWLPTLNKEQIQNIRDNFSTLLKNQLSTNSIKQLRLQQVPEQFSESQSRATDGKFTITI